MPEEIRPHRRQAAIGHVARHFFGAAHGELAEISDSAFGGHLHELTGGPAKVRRKRLHRALSDPRGLAQIFKHPVGDETDQIGLEGFLAWRAQRTPRTVRSDRQAAHRSSPLTIASTRRTVCMRVTAVPQRVHAISHVIHESRASRP